MAASQPSSASKPASAPKPAPFDERALLSNVRQLIFEGKRSGEGYFSKDGQRLIFQSEREPGNPFYQIYVLDRETGDVERVSPGVGKTTCAWIHPRGDRYLFSSTHRDPNAKKKMKAELDFRASGKSRRYSWDYDEHYDLYVTDTRRKRYRRLTKARGYDAEASFSPDGTKIAFASNRRAYTEKMSDADRAAFERDPAYMMDLYIMNADGTGVTRLTQTLGYDGGPFFSPDGQRIVWRRFTPDGATAEVWSMNIDGSDKKQLTRLGAMSWAPFYHPSGDYIIFTTNVHGFSNFELYLVDAHGKKEPARVTTTAGFDGLPVFSPDGAALAWTTNRAPGQNAQLFMADWDDAAARKLLALPPARTVLNAEPVAPDLGATSAAIVAADVQRHVDALTAPIMNGRLTGTPGEAHATDYVAEAFGQLGLRPAGQGGWFHRFTFTSGVKLGDSNVLVVSAGDEKTRPALDQDWRPLAFSKPGSVRSLPLAFAGYGIVARADEQQAAYDAYGDVDVKGRWAVVLRGVPANVPSDRRRHLARFATLRYKAMEARDRGAKGIVVVTGPATAAKDRLVPLRFDSAVAATGIPAVSMSDALASEIFKRAGHDLRAAQDRLDGGQEVAGFALPGTTIAGHIELTFNKSTGRNVLGRLQVGRRPSRKVIVIGAHVDHLGNGQSGDSLAKPEERGQVHPGADDNASGVAGLLEIAQYLADQRKRGKLKGARRDIVFAAWSGEELGLYGSTAWAKSQLSKKDEAAKTGLGKKVAAYFNMDMVGRFKKKAVLHGIGSSSIWRSEVERRNVVVGLPLTLVSDTYLPTDATVFYVRGVPILSAFTGAHAEYHTPRDTADRINPEGTARIARLLALIAKSVSQRKKDPDYLEVEPPKEQASRRTSRVYLGTIPEYAAEGVIGVPLSGVGKNGPAERAGVRGGDVIVGLGDRPIANIYDYVKALDELKIGEQTTIVVQRGDQRLTLPITPGTRD